MAGRAIEGTPTSPYAVLQVSRHATREQIKHAYRERAKDAHPDAGGSVADMARVNKAYQVIGDPEARRAYDSLQAHESHALSIAGAESSEPAPSHENLRIRRQRNAWARRSAWNLMRYSLPAAIIAMVLTRFLPAYLANPSSVFVLTIISFVPIYALVLSIIFLIDPALRLVFADIVRGHPTQRNERFAALAMILAFFPLAAIWATWQAYL